MAKANILVVDDDRIILDSLCEYLNIEGYAAAPAESFTEAADQLRTQPFALVITDVNMPEKAGTEVIFSLPQTPRIERKWWMITTGNFGRCQREKILILGFARERNNGNFTFYLPQASNTCTGRI